MYFTRGAKVSTIRFRSWGSFVSRYFFHSARVSSWEMRFRLLGSSFIGGPRAPWGRGGSRLDRPERRRPLANLHDLTTKLRRALGVARGFRPPWAGAQSDDQITPRPRPRARDRAAVGSRRNWVAG